MPYQHFALEEGDCLAGFWKKGGMSGWPRECPSGRRRRPAGGWGGTGGKGAKSLWGIQQATHRGGYRTGGLRGLKGGSWNM